MKRAAPIALFALALVATGCGSSGLSDASFTSQASAICRATSAASSKLSGSTVLARAKSEEAILARTVSKLQALSAPSNRASAFKSLVEDFNGLEAGLRQLTSAVTARDAAKIASAEVVVAGSDRKAKSAAKAAGLKSCG